MGIIPVEGFINFLYFIIKEADFSFHCTYVCAFSVKYSVILPFIDFFEIIYEIEQVIESKQNTDNNI